jgi:alpha-tubulin suppressor-like RCC1 family protein
MFYNRHISLGFYFLIWTIIVSVGSAQESVDLQFVNQLQANNTNVSLSSAGNWPAFSGTQMDFTNVASLPNGQSIDLRAKVVQVTGPFFYRAIVPNFNEGDLGFLYANNGYGSGGFVLHLDFFQGGGTFSAPYVMPKLRLTFYDVDGESIQSEGVRVFREDGFSGYELPSGDQSVTLTEESGGESFLFTGPGSDRSETDRSGAFMLDFTNTASLRLAMHSSTTGGSLNNPMFAAIDGDLSQIDSTGLAPEITREPTDLNLYWGTPGSFVVVATGAAPLRYQWKKGSTAIPGATNSTYTVGSAQLSDEGFYSVTISNNYGAVFSRSARLNVIQQVVTPDQITLYGLMGVYTGQPQVVAASSPDFVAADFRIEYESATYPKTTQPPVQAGSYQVTATVVKPGFGGARTATMEIQPAQLTITADSFVRFYGENNPVLTYRFNGWVNGEAEAVLTAPVLISTLADAASNAAIYEIVVSGAVAPNYAITFVAGQLTVLGGLANTISFPAVSPKTYGDAPFLLSATASSGLPVSYLSSDPQIAEVSGNVVTIRSAGQVTLTARQAGNENYLAAEDVRIDLLVQPKVLSVTGISAIGRAYDGTLEVVLFFGAASLSEFLEGDEVSLVTDGAWGRLSHPSPGLGKSVEVIGLQLVGADAVNYTLAVTNLSVDITARPIRVAAQDKTRRYGSANPEFTYTVASSGLALGDVLEVGSILSSATASSFPGSYPITLAGIKVRDVEGNDVTARYSVEPQDGILTVQRLIQTINFTVLPDKTYGDTPFTLIATASSGLPVTLESGNPVCLEIAGTTATPRGAGSAAVTARQNGSELWEPADPVTRMQVIRPKGLVVAARSLEIYVYQAPTFEFDVLTPLAAGDTKASVFPTHPSDPGQNFGPGWLIAAGWNSSLAGSFLITRSHLNSPGNYTITEFRSGLLKVLPGPGVVAGSISTLAGGQNHSLLLRTDNGVSTWGNLTGGLDQVATSRNIAGVAAGSSSATYSLAWTLEGFVLGWGSNATVVNPSVLGSIRDVVGLAGGANHGLALRTDGTVSAWGTNTSGQASVPANLASTNPVGFARAVAVSAAENYSVALLADGRVQFWGANSYVNSHLTNTPAGTFLARATNAVGLAAGAYGILTLHSDGSLQYHGLAGNGFSSLPSGLTNPAEVASNPAVAISAAVSHAVAILRDGQAVAWSGNLVAQTNLPTGLTNVAAVAAGNAHSLLLLRDGSLRVAAATNNLNRLFPADLAGAVPRGGPDSDGDGWSNEAELRAGAHPLQATNRPRKIAFLDGSLSRSFQEGDAYLPVGEFRVIEEMGWREDSLRSGVTLLGPDADKFRIVDGVLQTAVPLDFDAADSQKAFTVVLSSEGQAEEFSITLTDNPADNDSDGDGLSNAQELALGTNPNNPDTDGDGLPDGTETNTGSYLSGANTGTSPLVADTDGDGLSDGVESGSGNYVSGSNTGTNPLVADTDGDGRKDGEEIVLGISPFDPLVYPGKPVIPPQVAVAVDGQVTLTFSRILPLGGRYQLQSSPDLSSWSNVGSSIQGNGSEVQLGGSSYNPKIFYRVISVP